MHLVLSGKWIIRNKEYNIEARVPGDITDDFYRAGKIKDPYFNNNYKESAWITKQNWTYERSFEVNSLLEEENYFLIFDGIDTFSEIYLNDKLVGTTENMHRGYRFCVKEQIQIGTNTLKINLYNIYDKMGENEQKKYDSIFCANRIFVRKAQCHFGWDWAPRFPGYGIYRDVYLVSEAQETISEVAIRTENNGWINFKILFNKAFYGKIEICVSFNKKVEALIQAEIHSKRYARNLFVFEPKLWWPNGYGEQPIYEYSIKQYYADGRIEEKKGTFAFRKTELAEEIIDEGRKNFALKINGRKIFCKGSNWVPAECMTGRITDEKYYALVKAAKEANFNMLRVWGGGIYEKDCFYEYCDRMGIMIWQEFMFACSEIPEDHADFIKEITQEAEYQVKRLRNHPCLTLWCGMNEIRGAFNISDEERYSKFTLHYLFRGITGQLSPDIPYIRTSPFAFSDVENDPSEGDCHNNLSEKCLFGASFKGFDDFVYEDRSAEEILINRIKNYERYVLGSESNFISECAVLGMCNYESLKKFTPEENRNLQSDFFINRFLGNPYTYVMPTFFERQKELAGGMYGKPQNLKDLIKKANLSQSDIIRTEIVYARANGITNGILNWMYSDIWPTGTWSVIDYYLSKKPAYYQMKRCFVPLLTAIIRAGEKYYFCVVNDENQPMTVEGNIFLCKYTGERLKSYRISDMISCDEKKMIEIPLQIEEGDYLYASGKIGEDSFDTSYNLKRYAEKSYPCHYTTDCQTKGENEFELTIYAETFLPCFKIWAGENAQMEDNYFDLVAGEHKIVKIHTSEKKENFVFCSFFDEWEK